MIAELTYRNHGATVTTLVVLVPRFTMARDSKIPKHLKFYIVAFETSLMRTLVQ